MRLFTTAVLIFSEYLSSALIFKNPDASKNQCEFSDENAQEQISKFLFITHLYNESEKQNKTITSFFMCQSVYWVFFDKSVNLDMNSNFNLSQPVQHPSQQIESLTPQRWKADEIKQFKQQTLKSNQHEKKKQEQKRQQ